MKPIAGSANIFVDGVMHSSTGEFTAAIAKVTREEIVSADGTIYFSENPVASSISGSILLTESVKPDFLMGLTDATIQVNLRSGKTVMLSGAFFSGEGSLNAKDGTFDVEFKGRGKYV